MVLLLGGAQWAQNNGRMAVAIRILRLKSKMHAPRKNGVTDRAVPGDKTPAISGAMVAMDSRNFFRRRADGGACLM